MYGFLFHETKAIIFENWNKKKIGIDNGFHLTFVYYPDPDVTWQKQLTVYEKPVVVVDSSTGLYNYIVWIERTTSSSGVWAAVAVSTSV